MIDTIKFQIRISKECFKNIQKLGIETTRKDNSTNQEIYRVLQKEINIGSFDKKISIYCPDVSIANVELSLPKFLNGENVHLINSSEVIKAVSQIYSDITNKFGEVEHFNNWIIKRLDLCYTWKLKDKAEEEKVILLLKSLSYLRSSGVESHDTSIMWKGQAYSVKFYLKYPECKKHDYKELLKTNGFEFANKVLREAENILRFEITFRAAKIGNLLGCNIPYFKNLTNGNRLMVEIVFETLDYYLNRIIKVSPEIQDELKVFECLQNKYGKRKARRLEEFWTMYQQDEVSKARAKNNYSSSQIWRKLKDLKNADVGLNSDDINIDLKIDKCKLLANEAARPISDL